MHSKSIAVVVACMALFPCASRAEENDGGPEEASDPLRLNDLLRQRGCEIEQREQAKTDTQTGQPAGPLPPQAENPESGQRCFAAIGSLVFRDARLQPPLPNCPGKDAGRMGSAYTVLSQTAFAPRRRQE